MVRWLATPAVRPPRRVRVTFAVLGAAALAVTYALTHSDALQLLALVILGIGLAPAVSRRYGAGDSYMDAVKDREVPLRVSALALSCGLAWMGVISYGLPEFGLGEWFLLWAVLWPYLELHFFLAERDLRRRGAESWPAPRPLRDSAIAGIAVVPLIGVPAALLWDVSVDEAVLAGVLCGLVVFGLARLSAWSHRRARNVSASEG